MLGSNYHDYLVLSKQIKGGAKYEDPEESKSTQRSDNNNKSEDMKSQPKNNYLPPINTNNSQNETTISTS